MESLDDRIEYWIDQLERDNVFEKITATMEERQPDLLAYFYLPQFEDLTEEEGSYLLFLGALLYAAVTDGGRIDPEPVTLDRIQELEDEQWKVWEALPGKSFDEKVNGFPDDLWDPATDLVVSMLEHDPEMDVNWAPAVQEILLVSLLTFYRAIGEATTS